MAVTRTRSRRDTVRFTGPLAEVFAAAQTEITDYETRNWILANTRTDPNQGPLLELVFTKENE